MRSVQTYKPVMGNGKIVVVKDMVGKFHCFQSEDKEEQCGRLIRCTVGVIEFDDGSIETFNLNYFKFLKEK